jgi:hypothetical protein
MFRRVENFQAEAYFDIQLWISSSGKPYHRDKSKRKLLGKGTTDGVAREG